MLCFSIWGIPGDVDNNGVINIIDALMIAQYTIDLRPAGFSTTAADVDMNGAITIIDALIIAQYTVGLIPYFPSSTYKRLPVPAIKQNPDIASGGVSHILPGFLTTFVVIANGMFTVVQAYRDCVEFKPAEGGDHSNGFIMR